MKSYKIHLIRHGRTEANEKGLYIGKTDLALSPEGLARLLQLKKEQVYPPAARYFTSPLSRCRQTLEVLYPGCRQEVVDGLSECDFGEWDGCSIAQLKSNPQFQRWMAGEKVEIPGGEAAAAFQQRVTDSFEKLISLLMSSGDTEAVICTHGGVIMLLMAAYALPRMEMKEWISDSGCGFTLMITPTLWMREPVAECISRFPFQKEERTV